MKDQLRQLPKMDDLLADEAIQKWQETFTKDLIKAVCNQVLDSLRQAILDGQSPSLSLDRVISLVDEELTDRASLSFDRVVNATGTVLHTNLGRAILSKPSLESLKAKAEGYSNLEYNLQAGQRGSRYSHVEDLLCELTGAEAALVVNNNAAGVLLLLTALLANQEVLVSRGQLVEIGGSFRIPDIISSVGARLKEVGATNKTHLKDYEAAIGEETGAILKVHTSNYRVIGFSEAPSDQALVDLAHRKQLPIFNDLGSGLLLDLQALGLPYEPTVQESIQAGYDVVTFSGDKLLGGPQAGILLGKTKYIEQLKNHPLLRALRVDKFTIAALEMTLQAYRKPQQAFETIPSLQLLSQGPDQLHAKAEALKDKIEGLNGPYTVDLVPGQSQVGGGAYPEARLATSLVEISHQTMTESQLERALRLSQDHIIARIADGKVQVDVRTLLEGDLDRIVRVLSQIS